MLKNFNTTLTFFIIYLFFLLNLKLTQLPRLGLNPDLTQGVARAS